MEVENIKGDNWMTSNEFQALNTQNNERALEISKILIKAARKTYAILRISEAKCKKARDGIATHDKDTMWCILQEYMGQYAEFIILTSRKYFRYQAACFAE